MKKQSEKEMSEKYANTWLARDGMITFDELRATNNKKINQYPHPLDSPGSYFSALEWYVTQGRIKDIRFSSFIREGGKPCYYMDVRFPGEVFMISAETLQDCITRLHQKIIRNTEEGENNAEDSD